ncbi:MBL fold metallo-hydrolase [Dactylosporangium sp. McL0621]|uniref:MBL fold metallo-hydrolase n=1 Tax=Dactylosporangium sp. McL0621 TaxID=3415678 RepID=UPI003CFA86AC
MHTIELGDVSVTRIGHFDNRPLSPAEFFPGTDLELWEANRSWLAPAHWDPQADRVRIAVQTWLLRSGGRVILIDTGLSPDPARAGVPAGGDLPVGLAAAGVAPADVDLVICTHLHADHVGWNTRVEPKTGQRVPTFPNARYLFSRPDVDFFHPRNLAEGPGRSAAVFIESIEPILRAGQATVWDGSYTVDENLRLSLAPGHTPGLGVLTLESGGARAVFVGDLLHSPIQVLEPDVSSCFCHDPAAAARSRRQVLEWAADHNALVVPAHFGGTHAVEVARNGSGFTVLADAERTWR